MRYYSLRIGSDLFTYDIGVSGLAISFNIQNYKAGESVDSQIILHNLPVTYLGQYADWYDKRVFLQAGMRRTPQNGYIPPILDTIASGYVSSVIGAPNGADAHAVITFQRTKNEKPNKLGYTFNVKQGMPPDLSVQAAYLAVSGDIMPVTVINTLPSPKSIYEQVFTVNDIARVLRTIGLDLVETATGYRQVFASNPTPVMVKMITRSDLIGQPYAINTSEIMAPLYLRGDFNLGDTVIFSPDIFFSSQNLTNLRDIRSIAVGLKSLFSGTYQVTQIQHNGDLYNPSGDAWSTVIRCSKMGLGGLF